MLLNPAMKKIFDDVYGRFPTQYNHVYAMDNSERSYEKYSSTTGFDMAKDVGEAEEINFGSLLQKILLIKMNPKLTTYYFCGMM